MAPPIVLKYLSKTDIEKRMNLPSMSLKYFPPMIGDQQTVDFQVRDECDHGWDFRICTRKKRSMYLKPVLTKGWRDFVRNKGLRIGDRVAFYMEKEADEVKYRVEVEKEEAEICGEIKLSEYLVPFLDMNL